MTDKPLPVPKMIDFGEIVAVNGARTPPYETARQHIRQLWVMVTKPEAAMDLIAGDGGAKKADQLTEQATQLANLQKHRRAFNPYFYALTGYRGRCSPRSKGTWTTPPTSSSRGHATTG